VPREHAAAAPPVVLKMPRTKSILRRCEGGAEQQRAAAALAAALAPATHQHHDAVQLGGAAGAFGVTVKQEVEDEEETPEGQRRDLLALAPGSARVPASGPRAALVAAAAPTPHHNAPPGGAGAEDSEVTSGVKIEEGAEETLAQQRDRLALALAHGPVRVDSHIKIEDCTSGEDTDGDGEGEGEEGPGAERGATGRGGED